MKSCGCFLFGGEYEARTRDLLHAMQVYNFKVKSPKNLPYSAFTIKSTFYARLILHTFTHISVKICSFVCPKFKVYAYIFYRDQREERAAGR